MTPPLGGAVISDIAVALPERALPNAELLAELFPSVPLTAGVGPNETLLSIAKARRLLGYQPQYSWREAHGE